jgi:hypothetical protein
VFHQFLDATYQLLHQHPTRFEFNERFLKRLLYQLYACQYGTFLFNNEKERVQSMASERTRSVWDYFLCRREQFTNPRYDPVIDDHQRGKERLIFPRVNETRWWAEVFGREDSEMNGPRATDSPATKRAPVVTGIETANHSVGTGVPGKTTVPAATSAGMAAVTAGISNLAFPKKQESESEAADKGNEELGVEMQ